MTTITDTSQKDRLEELLNHARRQLEHNDKIETERQKRIPRFPDEKTTKQKEQEYLEKLKLNPDLEIPEELLYTTMTGMNIQLENSVEEYPTLKYSCLRLIPHTQIKQIKFYPESEMFLIKKFNK
jgi:uncharacterized protein YecA (UPF0149 family)